MKSLVRSLSPLTGGRADLVVVPVSMAPLQKEVYKSLLEKNMNALSSLAGSAAHKVKKSNLKNLLMQLRKYVTLHEYVTRPDACFIDACNTLTLYTPSWKQWTLGLRKSTNASSKQAESYASLA